MQLYAMLRIISVVSLGFVFAIENIASAETMPQINAFDLPIGIRVEQSSVGYRFLGDNPVRNPQATAYEIFAVFTVEFMALSIATNGQANRRELHATPIAENLTSLCLQSYQSVLAAVRDADVSTDSPAIETLTNVVARHDPERFRITVEVLPQTLETATHGKLLLSLKPYNAMFDMTDQECTLVAPSALKLAPSD